MRNPKKPSELDLSMLKQPILNKTEFGKLITVNMELNIPDQIEVSKPDSGTAVAKGISLIGDVEEQTRLRIGEVIERKNGDRFKDEILENGRLTDTDPLITAINFINSDSSSLWSLAESDETTRDFNRYKKLGDNNANRGRRFDLVARAINKYLDFQESNYEGRLTGEDQKII